MSVVGCADNDKKKRLPMPRIPRPVFAGIPHHVTQRGNRQERVFFRDSDRFAYLTWLREFATRYGADVVAYCLMDNHVHLIVVPATEHALEQVIGPLHSKYARRVNRLKSWKGHLWQGRYFSSPLDDAYLWAAVRYVERNPVRAGLVAKAEDYPWSSAQAHCGLRIDAVLDGGRRWVADFGIRDWSAWLAGDDEPAKLEVLRQHVVRRLPCGKEGFVAELERQAGQSLRPRPRGRPKAPPTEGEDAENVSDTFS
jgi:putative transposase